MYIVVFSIFYSGFKYNIWGVDLADMQSLSKYNKRIKYLLCAIDFFSKYAWIVPMTDKKGVRIVDAFQKILKNLTENQTKYGLTKGSEFYCNSFKNWLKDNDIEMYLIHNKGKSVVADWITTLKNKIFKHMAGISINVYYDVLGDIFNKYNNTVHRTIKWNVLMLKIIHKLVWESFYCQQN